MASALRLRKCKQKVVCLTLLYHKVDVVERRPRLGYPEVSKVVSTFEAPSYAPSSVSVNVGLERLSLIVFEVPNLLGSKKHLHLSSLKMWHVAHGLQVARSDPSE